MIPPIFAAFTALLAASVLASSPTSRLEARQDPDNTVSINDSNSFCIILPRNEHTDIGDSEQPGGEKTFCSSAGQTDSSQGVLPDDFWSNVDFVTGSGASGGRYAQLTGCILPEHVSELMPNDAGGQYDSSGGANGQGNPEGSVCIGYNHYVELVEPAGNRTCIRCCDDFDDCPVSMDTSGCPAVIPGNYFDCA